MNTLTAINWLALIAFYIGIFYFFHKNKKDVARQWGIFFAYRTQKGLKFIKNLALKLKGFWTVYGYIAIPVVFIAMIGMVAMLLLSVINMFAAPETAAPVAGLVVPWATTGVHGAIITVSIWYFIIAVIVTLVVHEGAHAVITATHKMRLKSTGVGLFAIIPFAFVEPDEEQIAKASTKKQLSVYAAGPFTNFITAAIVILIMFFLILPGLASGVHIDGLTVADLEPGSPADLSELQVGDTIISIDGNSLSGDAIKAGVLATTYTGALGLPAEKLAPLQTEPGQTIEVETLDGKIIQITAEAHTPTPTVTNKVAMAIGLKSESEFEPRGVVGLKGLSYNISEKAGSSAAMIIILGTLYAILAWVAVFNVGIGLFNTLPIGPLDGGRMVSTVIKRAMKGKNGSRVFALISTFVLATLLFGVFGAYLLKLF